MDISTFYDGYEVLPGCRTDGDLTKNEDCADVNRLRLVLNILNKQKNVNKEKFFKSAANLFSDILTSGVYAKYVFNDLHSNSRACVNRAFSTTPEFMETFNVQPTDLMYVAPKDMIVLW
jgi:putative endopeptidase